MCAGLAGKSFLISAKSSVSSILFFCKGCLHLSGCVYMHVHVCAGAVCGGWRKLLGISLYRLHLFLSPITKPSFLGSSGGQKASEALLGTVVAGVLGEHGSPAPSAAARLNPPRAQAQLSQLCSEHSQPLAHLSSPTELSQDWWL